MRLYVIRHADAVRSGRDAGHDADRPLSERGEHEAVLVGKFLATVENGLGAILCSPLLRARQTAAALGRLAAPALEPRTTEHLAPGFRPRALLHEVAALQPASAAAVVGHQPDLTAFVSFLTADGPHASIAFPPASVAMLSLAGDPANPHCSLAWLLPADLIARAFDHRGG